MFRRRVLILLGCFAAGVGVLVVRLGQMQLAWHGQFERQYRVSASGDRVLETARGTIYSADGEVLAQDVPSFDLSIHYRRLQEPDWLPTVSRLTATPEEELRARAESIVGRVQRIWRAVRENTGLEDLRIVEQEQHHPIVEDIPREVAVLVRAHREKFPHLKVTETSRRVYPGGDLAPHIIGRCTRLSPGRWKDLRAAGRIWTTEMAVDRIGRRYRMDDSTGASGLERQYESELRGQRGYVEHRLLFHPLRVERRSITTPPEPGYDLHLTLRADFQRAVNEALTWAEAQPDLEFRSGALVLLDVRTGALLAAGTYPSYERETYREDFERIISAERSPLLFRPTQGALPTGSVYKLISAVAGLEEGQIHAGTRFRCQGRVRFEGRWFHCTGYHRMIGLIPAIEHSCNAYFFQLAARLSGDQLAAWGRRFGLGQPTGIDLPFERGGNVPDPASLFARLNLGIGQGRLLVTPLQVARAMAALANGGRLVRPHLLSRVTGPDGEVVRRGSVEAERIEIDSRTLELVRRGMHRVVSGEGGTARRAGLERFDAAGKTGTAELGSGRPNHAWFAGYAPYEDPKIAFAVVSERTPGHGGSHAAPILARALEKIWGEL
mgnify:CR=1 FL=1